MSTQNYQGGCHCGAVRFETSLDVGQAVACNCSICQKTGSILAFAAEDQFKLVSGADNLGDYQFNKRVIHHLFCRTCGVRSFARGTRPDGREMVAVNLRCLDGIDAAALNPKPFDGRSL
jgi:hypothetical protein